MSEKNYSTQVFSKIPANNHSELLLKSFHLQKASEEIDFQNVKKETVCRKCLTFWDAGQFQLEIKPGNHKRKLRRKFLIEKYTKKLKETKDSKAGKTFKKIINRLTKANNHVAIYKCLLCNYKTKILLYKPSKQKIVKEPPKVQETLPKTEFSAKPPKEKVKKKKKKEKNHGLNIPNSKPKTQPTKPISNKNFDQKNHLFKLAEMLKTKSSLPSSSDKLKKMLK